MIIAWNAMILSLNIVILAEWLFRGKKNRKIYYMWLLVAHLAPLISTLPFRYNTHNKIAKCLFCLWFILCLIGTQAHDLSDNIIMKKIKYQWIRCKNEETLTAVICMWIINQLALWIGIALLFTFCFDVIINV